MITVFYHACDGCKLTRKYKTITGARRFAQTYVGKCPDIGAGYYAVSDDGVGKITVDGVDIFELFGIDKKAYYRNQW